MHKNDLPLLEFIHITLELGSVYTYKNSSHFVVLRREIGWNKNNR